MTYLCAGKNEAGFTGSASPLSLLGSARHKPHGSLGVEGPVPESTGILQHSQKSTPFFNITTHPSSSCSDCLGLKSFYSWSV